RTRCRNTIRSRATTSSSSAPSTSTSAPTDRKPTNSPRFSAAISSSPFILHRSVLSRTSAIESAATSGFSHTVVIFFSTRSSLGATIEYYAAVGATRRHEIRSVRTVFSQILLPLTLIAGIYGMNFERMPELHWLHGYPMALGLMAITALGLLIWFRRRGWIGG